MTAAELESRLDATLRVRDIPDDSLNGLQVANSGRLSRVALAVDASEAAVRGAASRGADFLIVHHGLFWGKPAPVRGALRGRLRALLEADIALYAAHLPLDLHPELGNNIQICRRMGWDASSEFGEYHGTPIGRRVDLDEPEPLDRLVERFGAAFGVAPEVWRFGPGTVRSAAVVSGGALSMVEQAAAGGCDVFLTGETAHSHFWAAREAGINVVFGGHYATETTGVAAVGAWIRSEFGLETVFLDLPTGY
jgi:dinuclear metal center YbgI/SA1388 family protein